LLLVTRLFYPSYSVHELSNPPKSPESARVDWLNAWFSWSPEATSIRFTRVVAVGCYLSFVILAAFAATYFQQNLARTPSVRRIRGLEEDKEIASPVCQYRFGGLSLYELAGFAAAAYSDAERDSAFNATLDAVFDEDWRSYVSWSRTTFAIDWAHPPTIRFFYNKSDTKVVVVGVRGTLNTVDLFADVELWAAPFVLDMMKAFIPVPSGYVDDVWELMGYVIQLPRIFFKRFSLMTGYIDLVLDLVRDLDVDEDTQIVLVGHSLGGGIAKLVSMITGIQAVAFSGPGISALRTFYEAKDEQIVHSFVDVTPRLEPFAPLDQKSGVNFMIPCEKGILTCHLLLRTLCMLGTMCGRYSTQYDFCYENLGSSKEEMDDLWRIGQPFVM
jgi:lipase ATG15